MGAQESALTNELWFHPMLDNCLHFNFASRSGMTAARVNITLLSSEERTAIATLGNIQSRDIETAAFTSYMHIENLKHSPYWPWQNLRASSDPPCRKQRLEHPRHGR